MAREEVLKRARRMLAAGNTKRGAGGPVKLALNQQFDLLPGEAIWGGSTAADGLGFRGHHDHNDLTPLIVADLERELFP